MALSWINVLTVAIAMTLTLTVVNGNEKYTTVPPEIQAELEEMDKSLDSGATDENFISEAPDFSGDVDPNLEEKVNKTKFTTPTLHTTNQDSAEDSDESTTEELWETTTEPQEDGSGDVDFFATQFPNNVQNALNETADKELLPASSSETTVGTTEEPFIPVLANRKPGVQSRPVSEDRETTVTDKPTTGKDSKEESVFAVPPGHSKSRLEIHDVNEAEELKPATTAAPESDNPSAQATKGNSSISRGAIVGIVIIGVILLLAFIILLVYLLVFRPRRKSLKHEVDADALPQKENGVANGAPKNNEESMTALVKELKDNKLSGKDKAYGTELKDDMENVKLNGTANKNDSPV